MSITQAATALYAEYREGRFPMAETAAAPALIVTPRQRGLLPIGALHIPASLRRTLRRVPFDVRIDTAFAQVITACAEAHPTRPETWINPEIETLFREFHRQGLAHSVECWQNEKLVGGVYGLTVGSVFCGESMFSRIRDASKVALVHLCARLFAADFSLLDAQFHNPHLEQFGLYLMPQKTYLAELKLRRDETRDFLLSENPQTSSDLLGAYLKNRGTPA